MSSQTEHHAETRVYLSELRRLQPAGEVAERHLRIDHPQLVEQHPRALASEFHDGSPWRVAEGG